MYILNNAEIGNTFASVGYPTFIIYPLAAAKILRLIAIWTKRSKTSVAWGYPSFLLISP
jgi:hypothetical protein